MIIFSFYDSTEKKSFGFNWVVLGLKLRDILKNILGSFYSQVESGHFIATVVI